METDDYKRLSGESLPLYEELQILKDKKSESSGDDLEGIDSKIDGSMGVKYMSYKLKCYLVLNRLLI